jgi:uncharacterized protein (TIGR00251 family)
MAALSADGTDCLLRVWAKPRARTSRVGALTEDQLEVQLAAPPADGQANEELRALLSRHLGVAKGRIIVDKGMSSRHKLVRLVDLSAEHVLARLRGEG